eukprot:10238831-Lingulodinium_polyedra.AAC.1
MREHPAHGQHGEHRHDPRLGRHGEPLELRDASLPGTQRGEPEHVAQLGGHLHRVEGHLDVGPRHRHGP